MQDCKNITPAVFSYLREQHTVIANRILHYMDKDRIMVYHDTKTNNLFIEQVTSFESVPDFVHDFILESNKHKNNIIEYVSHCDHSNTHEKLDSLQCENCGLEV